MLLLFIILHWCCSYLLEYKLNKPSIVKQPYQSLFPLIIYSNRLFSLFEQLTSVRYLFFSVDKINVISQFYFVFFMTVKLILVQICTWSVYIKIGFKWVHPQRFVATITYLYIIFYVIEIFTLKSVFNWLCTSIFSKNWNNNVAIFF